MPGSHPAVPAGSHLKDRQAETKRDHRDSYQRVEGLKPERDPALRVEIRRWIEQAAMPAGGGVLALSLSRKLLDAAGLKIGDVAEVVLERFPAAV